MNSKLNLLQEPTCAPSHDAWDENNLQVASEWSEGEMKKSLGPLENFETNCDLDKCQGTIVFRYIPHSMTIKQSLDHFQKFGNVRTEDFKHYAWYYDRKKEHLRELKIEYHDALTAQKIVAYAKKHELCFSWHTQSVLSPGNTKNPNEKDVNKQNGDEEDESTSECFFNNLPDELINYIFSYLDYSERIRVERVCKRWQHVNTNLSWVDMNVLSLQDKLHKEYHLVYDILVSILKRCGMTLREINFDLYYHDLTRGYSIEIAKYCPNLEYANLNKTPINATAIKTLVENCQNLHTLKLEACNGVDEKSLYWVLQKGKKIKYLDLSCNNSITGESFHLVDDRLETLILNGCMGLSSAHFLHLRNSRIKHLGINKCFTLTAKDLVTVIPSLNSTLTTLLMGGPFYQFDCDSDVFLRILERCPNLRHLELEKNSHVNVELIDLICKNCVQLRHINLSNTYLRDDDAQGLLQLPHLRSVLLNYMRTGVFGHISNEFLIKLSLPGKLEHVELRRFHWINDHGCLGLIQNSPNLKFLDVRGCENITDLTVEGASHIKILYHICTWGALWNDCQRTSLK